MESIRLLSGIILMIIIIVIAGSIAPWFLLIFITYLIYLVIGRNKRLKEVDNLLESEFYGKTQQEIEAMRISLTNIMNNPYSTQAEKDKAKHVIKYIEEHFYKNKQP